MFNFCVRGLAYKFNTHTKISPYITTPPIRESLYCLPLPICTHSIGKSMAIRKLHGSVDSIGTQRVLASLFEHQLDFDFIPVDLTSSQNLTPSFLSLSPFGEVPVLEDGDLILFETRAEMRYISHEYATQAIQQVYMTPMIQGMVATWIDVECHQFQPPALALIAELVDKPRRGQEGDEGAVAEAEKRLSRVLDVYEERLGGSEFLGGDKFTAADLTHTPYLHALMATRAKTLFQSRPRVGAWAERVLLRPAWARVLAMVSEPGKGPV